MNDQSPQQPPQQPPQSYICPIKYDIMIDPVIDHEGNSYERVAIENWLKEKLISPITRNPLTINNLNPNRALKDAIDEWIKQDVQQNK